MGSPFAVCSKKSVWLKVFSFRLLKFNILRILMAPCFVDFSFGSINFLHNLRHNHLSLWRLSKLLLKLFFPIEICLSSMFALQFVRMWAISTKIWMVCSRFVVADMHGYCLLILSKWFSRCWNYVSFMYKLRCFIGGISLLCRGKEDACEIFWLVIFHKFGCFLKLAIWNFLLQDIKVMDDRANFSESRGSQLVQVQKSENIIGKSIDKLKETSMVLNFLLFSSGRGIFKVKRGTTGLPQFWFCYVIA